MGNFSEVFGDKSIKSVEDYRQGFLNGMSADQKCPQTLIIMGKTLDEILALICKDEEEKFYQGEQWTQKEVKQMASRIMYRKEAEAYCQENGYKLFLDMCVKDKIIIMEREIETVCQTSGHYMNYGKIKVENWPEGLVLWVSGQIVWKSFK